MQPQHKVFARTLAMLSLTLFPIVASAAPLSPVEIVQQFVTDRATGHYPDAYTLLSAKDQQEIPAQQFTDGLPASNLQISGDGMTPLTTAVTYFFMVTQKISGYRFEVIGPDPSDASTVLVHALPPNTPASKAFLLKIATTQELAANAPRIQMMESYMHTSPEGFIKMRDEAQDTTSVSNLRQLSLCVILYAQDHDEHFPDADKWVDEIMPYAKLEGIFRDPSAPEGEKWSYAFNRNLSGISIAQMTSPMDTVMLFESTTGKKNASDLGTSVPSPGRHHGGTDYGMADGHVYWRPDGAMLSYSLSGKIQEHAQSAGANQTSESNMKEIALGIYQYCEDHDEHFPDADKWVDEVMPYVKSTAVFHDSSAPASEKWSYAFNRNLSGISIAQMTSPMDTVMLFESTAGTKNASDLGTSIPHPGRHHGGTDYGMADGRVNWQPDGATLSYNWSGK